MANPAAFVRRISHGRSVRPQADLKPNLPSRSRSNSVPSISANDLSKITLSARRSLSQIVVTKLHRTSQRDPSATTTDTQTEHKCGGLQFLKEAPAHIGATEYSQPTGTLDGRRKSSVGDFVLAAKARVHSLVKYHGAGGKAHGSQIETPLGVSTAPTFTDQYALDLPPSISPDKSELDFLRRTNVAGTTEG